MASFCILLCGSLTAPCTAAEITATSHYHTAVVTMLRSPQTYTVLQGMHSENGPFLTLIALLLWDVMMTDPPRGQFRVPHQVRTIAMD